MKRRNRRSIRLPEYDYSQPGAYHVTICVDQRENRLGQIVDGEMILNNLGRIANQGWEWLPEIFPGIVVDVFCVMPNHIHAIIRIKPIDDMSGGGRGVLQNALQPGSLPTAPTKGIIKPKPLGRLVGAYKTHTTVAINKQLRTPGVKFWQRNYYEHVIRSEKEYDAVWEYIENNPINWIEDDYNLFGAM